MRLAYKWQATLVITLSLFMAVLDNTIVSVALPQMQAYFHTSRGTINWVATAYFLAQAAVIPITGYLSDRIGTKTSFLTALALFTVGSGLCAIAPNETLLIAFRVLQGIGGGALFPVAVAIVFRVFPPAERGGASAISGVPVLLAPAFGPTIGGYLTTTFDWHAIFLVNLPIGVIAFALGVLVLHGRGAQGAAETDQTGEPVRDRGRFDVLGLALSVVGFTALVYGISEAGNSGWSDQKVVAALIAGGVLLVALVVTELRVSDPVMDLRLFRHYTFTMANLLIWLFSAFLFAGLFLLPIFFQQVQGYTPLQSGAFVITMGVAAAVGTMLAGPLYNRVGPRFLAFVGFALVAVGTIGFTNLTVGTSWQSLQGWLVLRGFGLGMTNVALNTLSLAVVSNRQMARASSLVSVMRQVAGAIGLTALTTYFVTQTATHATTVANRVASGSPFNPATPLGRLVAQCAHLFGAQAAQHQAAIQACVQHLVQQQVVPIAATSALNDTFLLPLISCAVSAVLALFLGRDPNLVAANKAAARGEVMQAVEASPALIGE